MNSLRRQRRNAKSDVFRAIERGNGSRNELLDIARDALADASNRQLMDCFARQELNNILQQLHRDEGVESVNGIWRPAESLEPHEKESVLDRRHANTVGRLKAELVCAYKMGLTDRVSEIRKMLDACNSPYESETVGAKESPSIIVQANPLPVPLV
jgi:hypothetical protein